MNLRCFLAFVTGLPSLGQAIDRPPPVSFEKPADYCGWLDTHIRHSRTKNAAEFYSSLFPESAENGGFPEPSFELKQRMDVPLPRYHRWGGVARRFECCWHEPG